jgi:hypothetical protein
MEVPPVNVLLPFNTTYPNTLTETGLPPSLAMTDVIVRLLFVAAKFAAVFVAQASVISPPPSAVSVPPVHCHHAIRR